MVKAIHTENAPAAIGPYSQAIQAGDFLYISGQIPVDPKTGELVEGIENQTNQVMKNLGEIMKEAGTDFSQAVKFNIYLKSLDHFATVNDIYGSYLSQPYPARACIEISKMPKDALVEMEAVVYTKA